MMPKTKKKSFTKRQEARKELMKKKRSDHTDDCLQIDLIENPIIKTRNVETNEVQSHNIETENLETNEIENPNVITENLETKVEPSNVITENRETNEVENPNIETGNLETNDVENPNTETGNLDIHDASIPVIRTENIALNGTETPIPVTVIGIVESEIGKDDKKLNDELACIFKNETKDKYSLNLGRYFEFQERQTKAKRLKNVQVEVAMKKDRKVYWREFKRRKRLSLQFKQNEAHIKQTKCLNPQFKETEKKVWRNSKKARRSVLEFREVEKSREMKSKSLRRTNPEYREAEKSRDMESKSLRRTNPEYREAEKSRDMESKSLRRTNPEYREAEKSRETPAKQRKRRNPEYRKIENEVKNKQSKRSNQEFREAEKCREMKSKSLRRTNPEYREAEKSKEMKSKSLRRTNPEYREAEKSKEMKSKSLRRTNPEYREAEKSKEMKSKILRRTNPEYREVEKSRETPAKQRKRRNPEYRKMENEVKNKQSKRSNQDFRETEKSRDISAKQRKRSNPEYKEAEKKKEMKSKSLRRSDLEYREAEKGRETAAKRNQRNEKSGIQNENLVADFHNKIKHGPTFSCECCHQLWFRHSVKKSSSIKHMNDAANLCLGDKGNGWICGTCESYIKKNKIPPCSLYNGMDFPPKPENLDLYPLEWRLLSPRIPFMKIYAAPRGKQKKIRGNVVNVPANVNATVRMLPRATDDTMTIAAQLKRQLKYTHAVMTENIRPYKIMEAAEWLQKNGKLYEREGICFDEYWNDNIDDDLANTENNKLESENDDKTENRIDNDEKLENKENEDEWSEDEGEGMSNAKDTLLTSPDFIENNEKEKIHNFAPGEGNIPMSIFMDRNSEEMSFPNIFYGNARLEKNKRKVPVYYSEICKSELRRDDRRAANDIDNIFFKLKTLQMKIVLGNASIALRKNKTEGKKITAGDLRTPGTIEKLVHFDEGYMILKTLRGSPPYFKKAKSDLFAMIRQLGPASFFCSFSAAETRWKHLLQILGKVQDGREYSDEEIESMDWETKCRLVSSDPVTCTRQFDYQVNLLFKDVLKKENSPIGKVTDFFYRVEFQHRGSPHIHTLLWVENAPIFGESSKDEITDFIENKISCSKNVDNEYVKELISYQVHKHSHTCRRKNQKICRFGFPKPPMEKTELLEPLDSSIPGVEIKKHKSNYIKMKLIMDDMIEGEDIAFDQFLEKINLKYDQYILAIRSSISHPTVFLKRTPNELRINAYNETLLKLWQANHDIQYVLDVYACAMYIASYIAKSQRGISDILRKACQEVRSGSYGIREQVKVIGNKFLNNVEVSSQEAVYIILQLPMRRSSREVVFINTSPPGERVQLLKTREELENMDEDDENIQSGNMLGRYQKRPKKLEEITLAEYVAHYDRKKSYTKRSKTSEIETLIENAAEHNSDLEEEVTNMKNEKRRNIPRVIRYVNFNIDKDPEKYYRELLMLYTSWRNENEDLIENFGSYAESYEAKKEVIVIQRKIYENNRSDVDAAIVAEGQDMEDLWDVQAPITQQNEKDDEHEENIEIEILKKRKEPVKFEYDLGLDLGVPKQEKEDEITLYEMPEDEYRSLMRSLNEKQMKFVYDTLHSIKTSESQIFRFLSGGAGVGKSFVTTALYQSLLRYFKSKAGDDFQVMKQLLLAPTGKAAYTIKGNTIHQALKVPVNQSLQYKPLDSSRLNTLRASLGGLKIVFIDEISMVGNQMLNFINHRLQDIKGSPLLFGGVSIIAVGDLFQLKPVFDGFVFETLSKGYGPLASNLWRDNFVMYELQEIMRQKDSKIFAELLNRFREGNHDANDIEILKTRIIQKNTTEYPYEMQHLFLSNEKMNNFNAQVFNKMSGEKFEIKAKDSVVGSAAQTVAKALLENVPNDPRKTMQLHTILGLVEGMKCELCINVRTEDGMTNGASCTIKLIETSPSKLAIGSIVWVEFENTTIGKKTRNDMRNLYKSRISSSWTPIIPVSRQIRIGKFKSAELMRTQIPLRPSAAKTVHRSQGDTLEKVVVDFDGRKMPHIHYVGLSRVKTLEGLHIVNLCEEKIQISTDVKEEMKMLRTERKMKCVTREPPLENMENLVIMHHNVRSLQKYIEDVKANKTLLKASIVILTETRLKKKDADIYYIPGFTLFRNDAFTEKTKGHHGIAVYIRIEKLKLKMMNVRSVNSCGIEISVISLSIDHNGCTRNLFILGLYKPPKISLGDLEIIINNLKSEINENDFIVILGDFNIQTKSEEYRKLNDKLHGMHQFIKEPTTDAGTTIDLIYSNVPDDYIETGTLENYYSDHKIIYSVISSLPQIAKSDSELKNATLHTERTESVSTCQIGKSKLANTSGLRYVLDAAPNLTLDPGNMVIERRVIRGFGYNITETDLKTLDGSNWLNDQVINFYLKIIESNENTVNNDVVVLDTFAYVRIDGNLINAVAYFLPQNLLIHDKIVIPIFKDGHWSLIFVFVRSKTIKYYDSIVHFAKGKQIMAQIKLFLQRLEGNNLSNWKMIYEKQVSLQTNGNDCGVFVCMNTELILQGRPLKVSRRQVLEYRKKMDEKIRNY